MLKRLAALLFIFAIAGQIYAGVCGCISGDNEPEHSCCKRDKADGDSLTGKTCCDADCVIGSADKLAQDRTKPAPQIQFQALKISALLPTFTFEPAVTLQLLSPPRSERHRLRYSRSPDLYLRHHAFLI